jgi:hypothetical protein
MEFEVLLTVVSEDKGWGKPKLVLVLISTEGL